MTSDKDFGDVAWRIPYISDKDRALLNNTCHCGRERVVSLCCDKCTTQARCSACGAVVTCNCGDGTGHVCPKEGA